MRKYRVMVQGLMVLSTDNIVKARSTARSHNDAKVIEANTGKVLYEVRPVKEASDE